jgi:predicted MFS family arabinose efflux permease
VALRLYAYYFLYDLVLLYPVYALLFADAGLSPAQISSLFILWSLTAVLCEVPSGALADMVSRRLLVALSPVVTSSGFLMWVLWPTYPSFAAGFVLWGLGGCLMSGALEALVYEELKRRGCAEAYTRLAGRSLAAGATGAMVAMVAAAPVLSWGGYTAVGWASVVAPLLAIPVALSFPEPPRSERARTNQDGCTPAGPSPTGTVDTGTVDTGTAETESSQAEPPREDPDPGAWQEYLALLRRGFSEVATSGRVARAVVILVLISGFPGALEEYVPLLARATGAEESAVPLLVLLVFTGATLGGWLAGRGTRWTSPALAAAAMLLALGALPGHPAGLVGVALAFGVFYWAQASAEARLQHEVGDSARATVTSVAGLGTEVVAIATFGAYALGSQWAGPGPLFAAAALPVLVLALALQRRRRARRRS